MAIEIDRDGVNELTPFTLIQAINYYAKKVTNDSGKENRPRKEMDGQGTRSHSVR